MPRDLHPSLTPGPAPRPICIGCSAVGPDAVLTPIRGSKTVFICVSCAGICWIDAHVEMARRTTMAAMQALAPEVAA